jgi:hypothetical protein
MTEFNGGSNDFVEDAIASLKTADKSFILLVMNSKDNMDLYDHLTDKSKFWLSMLLTTGALDSMIVETLSED